MKKSLKKLSLNRETVRTLGREKLENVAGGADSGKRSCPETTCGASCLCVMLP